MGQVLRALGRRLAGLAAASVVAVGLAGCTQCGDNLPDPEARDAGTAALRPALPRPPSGGLPAELRPPR